MKFGLNLQKLVLAMTRLSNIANPTDTKRIIFLESLILAISAINIVFIVGWLLWYSGYGLDFTDEGFYLAWMLNPYNYSVSASQFGFIYHPLYKILDGNVANLRQANILITFLLAWLLSNIFLKKIYNTQSIERLPRLIISGSIAIASFESLVFAGLWLPTPSYNSLTLQSLLITGIGVLLAEKYGRCKSIIGWCLIGVGGWLAFMAKPTTSVALAVTVGFYLQFSGKFSLRLLMISLVVALALTVSSALFIDGSVIKFVERLKGGAEMYFILGGGHEADKIFRLDSFNIGSPGLLFLVVCAVLFFIAANYSQAKLKSMVYCSHMLSIFFVLMSLGIALGISEHFFYIYKFQGLLIFSIPYAACLVGLSIYFSSGLFQISQAKTALSLTFLVFPHVYAFGTANNYWIAGSMAGIFWVLAGLVMIRPDRQSRNVTVMLLPLGIAVQLVTVALIQSAMQTPYRQPQPLADNDAMIEISFGNTLMLSRGFAQYITEAKSVVKQAKFSKGTPMIDLTGQSPGLLYLIGANNIGQPWTVGGYSGSDALAVSMLNKVTCQDLAKSWLLIEPEGPLRIAPSTLLSFGANLEADYEVVGSFHTAEGAGGFKEVRQQEILKPIRPIEDAMAACFARRLIK